MDKDAVLALIASYRDTLYDYSWALAEMLYISVVYSISDGYRNTEYRVSLMIQRYSVSSSNTL